MKEVDYIIVGFGLAGVNFAEQLRLNKKSFIVIDSGVNSSSQVAGGMYNPVILKRFTLPWNSIQQLDFSIPFYKNIEKYLDQQFLYPYPVKRIFNSTEEENNWLVASDKIGLNRFLSIDFQFLDSSCFNDNKIGIVNETGRLFVSSLLKNYSAKLKEDNSFIQEKFIHDDLKISNTQIEYQNIIANKIVFCEGFGLKNNPFFNDLPLLGTKGETLIIKSEQLNLNSIIKSGVFIIPLEIDNHYLIGATYNWSDKTCKVTNEAKQELLLKLNEIITCDFEVVNQKAGIRPTVKDRRPLVGQHSIYKNMFVLNGLGTRGVMVAPLLSNQLYHFIENDIPLDSEVNIERYS